MYHSSRILLALLLAQQTLAAPRVFVEVMPRAVFHDDSVRVSCRRTPTPEDRELAMGIVDGPTSARSIDPEDPSVLRQVYRVYCGHEKAFCSVRRSDGKWEHAYTPLVVVCNSGRK